MRTNDYLVIAGISLVIGAGAYLLYHQFIKPKQPTVQFERPPPTNLYVPDVESERQDQIRRDYENVGKLVNTPGGWNIANVHPTYQKYLNNKWGLF